MSIFEATRDQVDYALSSTTSRTARSTGARGDNAKKQSERGLDQVERVLEENGFEGHELNWSELVDQFGFDIHPETLQRRMKERGFDSFVAYTKPSISED